MRSHSLWPFLDQFIGDGPTSALVAPEFHTIEEAVCEFIRARTADEEGLSVVYLRRPKGYDEFPCVIVTKTSDEREQELGEETASTEATFTFTVEIFSTDPEQVVRVGDAIKGLDDGDGGLDGFKGRVAGRNFLSCWLDDENDQAEEPADGSDEWIYGRDATYSIIAED